MEAEHGWERLFYKHSPSKMADYSPIRPTAHLVGNKDILNEIVVKGHMWTLLNTEEFYYQNSSTLVHHYFHDAQNMCLVLNDQRNIVPWNSRLIDYIFIGEGNFGEVYQATDKLTNENYALKVIKPMESDNFDSDVEFQLYEFLSFLLLERNMFAELNHSPFFVRMLATFQSSDMSRFWFVLDYCVCDLQKLISLHSDYNDPDQLVKNYIDSVSFNSVSANMTETLNTNYNDLVFIYLFEMCAALHYLASHHIVHADIKLENGLIARNGHLKLSDFGVSFRNQWFDRNSIAMLPQTVADMNKADERDKEFRKNGSVDYYDPELIIDGLLKDDLDGYQLLKEILSDSKYFRSVTNMHQNFMSDLFAVGMVIFELITGGISINNNSISPNEDTSFWGIQMIYSEDIRQSYLADKIRKFTECHQILSVLEFLLTIFLPREIRIQEFRKEIAIFHQKQRVLAYCIDIHRLENIVYYKSKSITKENVVNIIFPEDFRRKIFDEFYSSGGKIANANELNLGKNKKNFNLHPFGYSTTNK